MAMALHATAAMQNRPHLLALAIYAALTLVTLGPLHPLEVVWGNNTSDVFNHLNLRAWQADQAARGRLFPVQNCRVHYPDGGTIYLADALGGRAAIPLVWLGGAALAYNALVLASLVFGCWAMFWLVRRRGGGSWCALLAGCIYGLNPMTVAHAHNGVTEMLQTGWLPLLVGMLLALADDASRPTSWRRTLALCLGAAAAWWAAAVGSHWLYGVFAGLLFGLLLLPQLWRPWRVNALVRGAAVLWGASVLLTPVVYHFLEVMQSETRLTRGIGVAYEYRAENSADLAYLFSSPALPQGGDEVFLHLAFLGFVVPALALWAVIRARPRRRVVGWLAAAGLFAVLALGPRPVVNGQALEGISLPFAWLGQVLPLFGELDFPYRLFLLAHLCLALAVGLGLAGAWAGRRWRVPLLLALTLLAWGEPFALTGLTLPAPTQRVQPPAPVAALAGQAGRFAVFDLPVSFKLAALNRYVAYQAVHGRPIPYSNFPDSRFPMSRSLARQSLVANLLALAGNPELVPDRSPIIVQGYPQQMRLLNQARGLLACLGGGRPCTRSERDALAADKRRLAALGLTRFVLHRALVRPGAPLASVCQRLFGAPVASGEGVELYRLVERASGPRVTAPCVGSF